jgi:hypothetical protein
MDSKSTAGRPSRIRSAFTNDPLKIRGVDGRSEVARRYRDVVRSIAADLGGLDTLSEPQRIVIRQAGMLSVQIEQLQGKVVAGDVVDLEQSIRLSNVLTRVLATLGLKKGNKPENGASALQDYLASVAARDDADDVEADPLEADADANVEDAEVVNAARHLGDAP